MNLETLIREGSLTDQISALTVLQEASAGLWLVDAAGTTAWVNPAAIELVGIRAEELLGARAPSSSSAATQGRSATSAQSGGRTAS